MLFERFAIDALLGNRSTKWYGRGQIAGVTRGSDGGGSRLPSVTRRQSRAIS